MSNTRILHQDDKRTCTVTGVTRDSANRKTGAMLQVTILPRDTDPVTAQRDGTDAHVCGSCPLRPLNGSR